MAMRVYFAFHYEDLIDFHANVIRKQNFTGGVEAVGYYDHSIWEEAMNTNPLALKRLINAELRSSSVTAVLIGTHTWSRRWVRYEIMKSIERGIRIIGVHINSINGNDKLTKEPGPNPFDNLALEISTDGTRAKPAEWKDGKWVYYTVIDSFTIPQHPEAKRGKHLTFADWFPFYDWVANRGFDNFGSWIA